MNGSALRTARHAMLDALAVLAPTTCSGCGADDRALCDGCRAALMPGALEVQDIAVRDAATRPGTDRPLSVYCGLEYAGTARRVLVALKETGRTDAAHGLAPALLAALDAALRASHHADGVELAVIPSSRAAFRRRGYHPVRLVLASAGLRPARVLRAARQTHDQSELGVAERRANRAGSLVARAGARGRAFLIVDDILTTGATIGDARRALEAVGATVIGGAVIAHTRRRLPGGIQVS